MHLWVWFSHDHAQLNVPYQNYSVFQEVRQRKRGARDVEKVGIN